MILYSFKLYAHGFGPKHPMISYKIFVQQKVKFNCYTRSLTLYIAFKSQMFKK